MLREKILSYCRKTKSLEELSRKFISHFEEDREVTLELDKVTSLLKVERRRIYDIINIYESLNVVQKAAKNNYVWRGLRMAVTTITAIIQSEDMTYSCHEKKKTKSLENLSARFLRLFLS